MNGHNITGRLTLNSVVPAWLHLTMVVGIMLGVGIMYLEASGAYFCAYDDFNEIHRAAFEDVHEPWRIFTTPHFDSANYRPLNRAMTLLTYRVGHGKPIFFRVRNLCSHLLNVALVYGLGWSLFKSMRVSSLGALLFGLHPLVNQSVNGTVWTNTMAHTGFLLALAMFIVSVRARRRQGLWLAGGLVSGWLSLLTYDSEIIVFGLMVAYLVLPFLIRRERLVQWRFVVLFAALTGTLLGVCFLLRMLFVPYGWKQASASISSPGVIMKNVGMYMLALVLPVDSVLANEYLHTPLPSEIEIDVSMVVAIGTLALVVLVGLVFMFRRWTKSRSVSIPTMDWVPIAFLACGIVAPLLPVLLLVAHPSETYLYLPTAFYTLLLSCGLDRLLLGILASKGRALYVAVVLVLVGLFGAATWVRNQRVVRCGEVAQRILSDLPDKSLMDDVQAMYFANVPGEPVTRRYGLYGFRGIDTIGHGAWADHTIRSALQLVYQDESLTGEIMEPEELITECQPISSSHRLCLWVHSDGRVEPLSSSSVSAGTPVSTFFPIGFMLVQSTDWFPPIVAGGFNIVNELRKIQETDEAEDYLDQAEAAGLQVIQNMPYCSAYHTVFPECEGYTVWNEQDWSEFISTLSTHDNLVAWYLPDEITDLAAAANLYQWVKRYDPLQRPVYANPGTFDPEVIQRFPAFSDFLWGAWYPEYYEGPRAIVTYGARLDAAACQGTGDRWGTILQFFDNADVGRSGGHPTPHELRCDSYQAIIAGATGLWYFAYALGRDLNDLSAELETIADEIIGTGGLDKVILSPDVSQTITRTIVSGPTQSPVVQGEVFDSIQTLQKVHWGTYIFATNIATSTVVAELGNLPVGARAAEVLFEGREIPIAHGVFRDTFEEADVHIYWIASHSIYLPCIMKLRP